MEIPDYKNRRRYIFKHRKKKIRSRYAFHFRDKDIIRIAIFFHEKNKDFFERYGIICYDLKSFKKQWRFIGIDKEILEVKKRKKKTLIL